MEVVNMHEAKSKLSKLVQKAVDGEEIIIAKSGKPTVKLVPLENKPQRRVRGRWKGKVWLSPDWEEWPEDIQKSFDGENEEVFD
ncbi:MAG: type II toxin-antitoxin system prevent-host-death family antitoxin [Cyclobacteriaceae bacterium]